MYLQCINITEEDVFYCINFSTKMWILFHTWFFQKSLTNNGFPEMSKWNINTSFWSSMQIEKSNSSEQTMEYFKF